MDAHPFLCAVSGLTKGWAVVRDLSHTGKGTGCLCGDLVGEDAINNIYIYTYAHIGPRIRGEQPGH